MGKNILIFSDGTGQAGGITFDEDRTNIYKLYRATRCGPDSLVSPEDQVAFYDAGLGSPADGGFMWGKAGRWLYNLASQATGLGLTANIIDCYAALIRLYRDGDRVFLFGFSRGAYTVRCLAAVIARCGIPRTLPGGIPLPLDVKGSRKLATEAVKDVYQFCSSRPREGLGWYGTFLLDTRDLISRRFREEHKSSDPQDPDKANIYPYFVGVFDTVAALARPAAIVLLIALLAIILFVASYVISLVSGLHATLNIGWLRHLTFGNVSLGIAGSGALVGLVAIVRTYVKYDFGVPGYNWWQSLRTLHAEPPKHKFTDYTLNPNVAYAKHAISIDENRHDFPRVRWNPDAKRSGTRDANGNIFFEQVWFSGVHADVGGGYPENESRLSDVTLQWMLAAASLVPDGIRHNAGVLHLHPDATGPQHDECKAGHWQHGVRVLPADTAGVSRATMHKSVYVRFKASAVVHYDTLVPYRPGNMANHVDFSHHYGGGAPPAQPQAVADDIEAKWIKAGNPGAL